MSPKASQPFTFDPDGDLILVLTKLSKTQTAASQKAGKLAAEPPSSKRKRDPSTLTTADVEPEKVNMIVSSKHMILASPVFKAMLAPGSFKEGLERNATGQLEVELPEDDQVVMIIVLNIIHGRNRVVPKRIDLNMLTNLAILVDKYQMVEAVESFSEFWIDHLLTEQDFPDGFPDDIDPLYQQRIHKWLAVSWVFRRKDEFTNITKAAIICCTSKLASEVGSELPIPGKIIGTLLNAL